VKVVKVQKKNGRMNTYWATIEYTKEELEEQFPSIDYSQSTNDEGWEKWDAIIKTSKSFFPTSVPDSTITHTTNGTRS